jgi:hypothetical protein
MIAVTPPQASGPFSLYDEAHDNAALPFRALPHHQPHHANQLCTESAPTVVAHISDRCPNLPAFHPLNRKRTEEKPNDHVEGPASALNRFEQA